MKSSVFVSSLLSHALPFTLTCPLPENIRVTPSAGSFAAYRYDADIALDVPALKNQLHMTAEGNAAHIQQFYAATWTDRTFLCLYNSGFDVVVLYDTGLDPWVSICGFYVGSKRSSDCQGASPSACQLICERSE
jgi:hypothetical protein